ncbi:MAG: PriCT-2 domain-containing protein [Patescibacteria group bacterium]|nr:PriCT-2 domain-containing protein [Patescibacteria group bacterium]
MAKVWQVDGVIKPYDDAKHFIWGESKVGNIQELSALLTELERDSRACVIRGGYVGDHLAAIKDDEHKRGRVRRLSSLYDDSPHHWVLIEIDDFEPLTADPVLQPVLAIDEFTVTCLPACFQGVSYHWQLSNSAGHIKNKDKLKAHVWFWLNTAYTSAQMKSWAIALNLPIDRSVLNTVQVHYTAAPVFSDGVVDPVPVRSGFAEGFLGDEVDLCINVETVPSEDKAKYIAEQDDPLMDYEPAVGLELKDIPELLKHVDNEDYDTWLKVGMSLHHEFSGSLEAMQAWDVWSSTASNYASTLDTEMRWSSFGSGGRSITARWLLKVGNQGRREAAREVVTEVKAVIADCIDPSELLGSVAKRAGEVAAGDIAARIELSGFIQSRFKVLTKGNVSIVDVRAAMTKQQTVERFNARKYHSTEFGNVARMMDQHGDSLMYVPEVAMWYTWTGIFWKRCTGVEVERLAKETIIALPDEAKGLDEDARAAFFQFCAISQKANMVKNMEVLARSEAKVVTSVSALDADMNMLGVANGAVDLRTGEFIEPNPELRITTITDTEYRPNAKATLFEKTVSDAFFGDAEMVSFFQRLIGYSILGKPTEDFIVIPFGSGSNGKSTIFNAIRAALGDHARTANVDTFVTNGNAASAGGAREDVLRLRGSRFVTVSEPEEGAELRESLIKAMTGGEAIPARGLYSRTTTEVVPSWTVFMPTNHKPIVKGDDHGIWRRLLMIPFTRNYDHDLTVVKDLNLAEKLLLEAPGILAWAVRGAIEYQRIGLCPPASVRASREAYKVDMDLLAEWLDECCEVSKEHLETNAKIWASWEAFAKAKGELRFISSNKLLSRKLQSRGFELFQNNFGIRGRGFCGLRVRVVGDFE